MLLVDQIAFQVIQSISSPVMDQAMQFISLLGNAIFWLIVIAVIYWSGRKKESLFLSLGLTLNLIVTGFFKELIARPRPSELDAIRVIEKSDSFSMPSGHASVAATMFGFNAMKSKNFLVGLLAGILIVLVMISRIYLGAHYLSDTLAGLIVGLIIALILIRLYPKFMKLDFSKKIDLRLFSLILIASLAIAFVQGLWISGIFFGFFAGYFYCEANKLNLKIKNSKHHWKVQSLGFIGLMILIVPVILSGTTDLTKFFFLFASGFWISYGVPFLVMKTKLLEQKLLW